MKIRKPPKCITQLGSLAVDPLHLHIIWKGGNGGQASAKSSSSSSVSVGIFGVVRGIAVRVVVQVGNVVFAKLITQSVWPHLITCRFSTSLISQYEYTLVKSHFQTLFLLISSYINRDINIVSLQPNTKVLIN